MKKLLSLILVATFCSASFGQNSNPTSRLLTLDDYISFANCENLSSFKKLAEKLNYTFYDTITNPADTSTSVKFAKTFTIKKATTTSENRIDLTFAPGKNNRFLPTPAISCNIKKGTLTDLENSNYLTSILALAKSDKYKFKPENDETILDKGQLRTDLKNGKYFLSLRENNDEVTILIFKRK